MIKIQEVHPLKQGLKHDKINWRNYGMVDINKLLLLILIFTLITTASAPSIYYPDHNKGEDNEN